MLMSVASRLPVFDPRGRVEAGETPLAPRPATLAGLRLGVLDNSKWNAGKLLRAATAALDGAGFAAVTHYVKHSFSKDAAPELIAEIARDCDVVLTAIGDCGSCTSCCIRDALALERLGVPTAAIVTTEFVRETELTRRALGMPALEPVVIDHPLSSITAAEIGSRAARVAALAPGIWLGRTDGA